MKISKLLPRCIVGYSKHTPKSGKYPELYFNNRKPLFANEPAEELNLTQKIKLGFSKLKNYFTK